MSTLSLSVASGESSLSVNRFTVHETISSPYSIRILAVSPNQDLDFDAIVGEPASFEIISGYAFAHGGGARRWSGICSYLEQVQVEPTGVATYFFDIVPTLWLLSQRRNHRIFQHLTVPDIIDKLLAEWAIEPAWKIDKASYPRLPYKVQYGETDLDFFNRLLEEAGIGYFFADSAAKGSELVLGDTLHSAALRPESPIRFADNPNEAAEIEYVTNLRMFQEVRPGAHAIRDYDFTNARLKLMSEAPKAPAPENRYEQFQYEPGAFLAETSGGGDSPVADDHGATRYVHGVGVNAAQRRLAAERMGRRAVAFETNAVDLSPGTIVTFLHHPHSLLASDRRLLITELALEGSPNDRWTVRAQAVFADLPYRPAPKTPKPRVQGTQTALVVGPAGQEIYTDEYGRVRVHFPWDRPGKGDDTNSCWLRVSQGWAGTGYGLFMVPRIGQEVLVSFLEGDADQPIVVGRVFNSVEKVPYPLPRHKTRSTWKSNSSPNHGGPVGFNEIMFEDEKGSELVYMQAEKNLRRLVKHDETITIGHNRQKLVKHNEIEKTLLNRIEIVGVSRTQITGLARTEITGGARSTLVGLTENEVVKGAKSELIGSDSHLRVRADRNEKVDKSLSVVVGKNHHAKVGSSYAIETGEEIHLKSSGKIVIEAPDITIKGDGGFIRIDPSGVIIKGTVVRINSGGSPGAGGGSSPTEASDANEAAFEPPIDDDVATSMLGR